MENLYFKKPEMIFVKLAFIFGLLYVFLIPPYQMPDEVAHMEKAYVVAHFDFLPSVNEEGVLGNYIPNGIIQSVNDHTYMVGDINQKYSFSKFHSAHAVLIDNNISGFHTYNTASTHPILYLPQSIGMLFNSLLSVFNISFLSPISYMYAGRIGNLLFFIFCMFHAIRLIPFYKNLLVLLGLMPMTLTLASSLNYDVMVISITMLWVSLILNYAFNENIKMLTKRDNIILIVLAIILIELKQVYFPIVFLYFIIPVSKFVSKKNYYFLFSLLLLCPIITHLLWSLVTGTLIASPKHESLLEKEQLMYIVENPIVFLKILINTFRQYSFFYLNSFIGSLGWLDTNFPMIFIALYFLMLIIVAIFDTNPKINFNYKFKLYWAVIGVICVVIIATSIYIIWTSLPNIGSIGHPIILGIQGRYFIPIAILLLSIFYLNAHGNICYQNLKFKVLNFIPNICIFSCVYTLLVILLRYWI